MSTIGLTGLVKIELPDDTIRFCDGGFFVYGGETYRTKDSTFGTIGALQTMSEGVGDMVPAVIMTIMPPTTEGAAILAQPGNQTSRVTFVIAEYDLETGVISTGDIEFSGQIDQTSLQVGPNKKNVGMTVVSLTEKLFERNTGNSMNPEWHKSIHTGERGHDNATGLGRPVAWGVEQSSSGRGGGGSGGGGGGVYEVWPTPRGFSPAS